MQRHAKRALRSAQCKLMEFTLRAAAGAYDHHPYLEVQSARANLVNAYREARRIHAIIVEGKLS
ncbi:MAG: hypothetical protein WD825_17205 [Gemmatimonadaceae bacterium]